MFCLRAAGDRVFRSRRIAVRPTPERHGQGAWAGGGPGCRAASVRRQSEGSDRRRRRGGRHGPYQAGPEGRGSPRPRCPAEGRAQAARAALPHLLDHAGAGPHRRAGARRRRDTVPGVVLLMLQMSWIGGGLATYFYGLYVTIRARAWRWVILVRRPALRQRPGLRRLQLDTAGRARAAGARGRGAAAAREGGKRSSDGTPLRS